MMCYYSKFGVCASYSKDAIIFLDPGLLVGVPGPSSTQKVLPKHKLQPKMERARHLLDSTMHN